MIVGSLTVCVLKLKGKNEMWQIMLILIFLVPTQLVLLVVYLLFLLLQALSQILVASNDVCARSGANASASQCQYVRAFQITTMC